MKNISAVYFSPTGGTRKAVLNLASGMGGDIREVDLCTLKGECSFESGDLVIVGMPVFGGRIPGFAAKLLKQCRGNGAVAVTVAVYGNRAFEDALVELNDALKELGFKIGASAALLAEHSMAREVAAGRPDNKDEEDARGFAGRILEKLAKDGWQDLRPLCGTMSHRGHTRGCARHDRFRDLYAVHAVRCCLSGPRKVAARPGPGHAGAEAGPGQGNPKGE